MEGAPVPRDGFLCFYFRSRGMSLFPILISLDGFLCFLFFGPAAWLSLFLLAVPRDIGWLPAQAKIVQTFLSLCCRFHHIVELAFFAFFWKKWSTAIRRHALHAQTLLLGILRPFPSIIFPSPFPLVFCFGPVRSHGPFPWSFLRSFSSIFSLSDTQSSLAQRYIHLGNLPPVKADCARSTNLRAMADADADTDSSYSESEPRADTKAPTQQAPPPHQEPWAGRPHAIAVRAQDHHGAQPGASPKLNMSERIMQLLENQQKGLQEAVGRQSAAHERTTKVLGKMIDVVQSGIGSARQVPAEAAALLEADRLREKQKRRRRKHRDSTRGDAEQTGEVRALPGHSAGAYQPLNVRERDAKQAEKETPALIDATRNDARTGRESLHPSRAARAAEEAKLKITTDKRRHSIPRSPSAHAPRASAECRPCQRHRSTARETVAKERDDRRAERSRDRRRR